jgi:predicted DsbA family dithiol-disulfide isomerase
MVVVWRALPLHEEIPPEGMSLEEFMDDPHVDVAAMLGKFRELARERGLEFNPVNMVCNTRLAHELRAWSREQHAMGAQFERRAFAAYFVEGKNLGDTRVLLDLVHDLGLPRQEAHDVLEARVFQPIVDRDLAKARKLEIMAAPTFLAHGKRLVGAHPLEVLRDFSRGRTLARM